MPSNSERVENPPRPVQGTTVEMEMLGIGCASVFMEIPEQWFVKIGDTCYCLQMMHAYRLCAMPKNFERVENPPRPVRGTTVEMEMVGISCTSVFIEIPEKWFVKIGDTCYCLQMMHAYRKIDQPPPQESTEPPSSSRSSNQ
jgi:hypothetical protein